VTAINAMLALRDLPRIDIPQYREMFRFPVHDYYLELGFDLDSEDWDGICRQFHDLYGKASSTSPLRPGAVRALEELRAHGFNMQVLSASELSILARMTAERGVTRFFSAMYGLSDLRAQSKAELGRHLVASSGQSADRMLLIGDTSHDWEVAGKMGCACLLMAGGHESEERLKRCGCPVVPDMPQLVERILGDRDIPAFSEECVS
jgi:phosphoglycolate phosphatase